MTPDQRLLLIGGYISSALYLSGCFVAGLELHIGDAWKAALLAAGFSCVAYAAQLAPPASVLSRKMALSATGISWGCGMVAGIALLFGG